jgi:hypothetical protein
VTALDEVGVLFPLVPSPSDLFQRLCVSFLPLEYLQVCTPVCMATELPYLSLLWLFEW